MTIVTHKINPHTSPAWSISVCPDDHMTICRAPMPIWSGSYDRIIILSRERGRGEGEAKAAASSVLNPAKSPVNAFMPDLLYYTYVNMP